MAGKPRYCLDADNGAFLLFCGSSNLSLNFFSFVNDILAEISSRNIYSME